VGTSRHRERAQQRMRDEASLREGARRRTAHLLNPRVEGGCPGLPSHHRVHRIRPESGARGSAWGARPASPRPTATRTDETASRTRRRKTAPGTRPSGPATWPHLRVQPVVPRDDGALLLGLLLDPARKGAIEGRSRLRRGGAGVAAPSRGHGGPPARRIPCVQTLTMKRPRCLAGELWGGGAGRVKPQQP